MKSETIAGQDVCATGGGGGGSVSVQLRKFEATIGSIKLDVGGEGLHQYSKNVISYCADFGTESLFSEDSWACIALVVMGYYFFRFFWIQVEVIMKLYITLTD